MEKQPALFLSHGAPILATEDGPAHRYLKSMGHRMGKPEAIIIMSAHHCAAGPRNRVDVVTDALPGTVHDFRGFPDDLYALAYPAPGAPELAVSIIETLRREGFDATDNSDRGYDHGAWVPLMLMYPDADIPVVQLSMNMAEGPEWHYRLGAALAPLRAQGALLIGSGNATHNLSAFFEGGYGPDTPAPDWVQDFAEWLAERIEAGDRDAVLTALDNGPNGKQNHPTTDHILPLYFAMGAGGMGAGDADSVGARLHQSVTYGVLAMDMYGFGDPKTLAPLTEPPTRP